MEELLPRVPRVQAQDIQNTGEAAVAVTGFEDMEDTTASVAVVDTCRGRGVSLERMRMVVVTSVIIMVSFVRPMVAVRRICRANCRPWRIAVVVAVPGEASILGQECPLKVEAGEGRRT